MHSLLPSWSHSAGVTTGKNPRDQLDFYLLQQRLRVQIHLKIGCHRFDSSYLEPPILILVAFGRLERSYNADLTCSRTSAVLSRAAAS
jgi:hypothetical protein